MPLLDETTHRLWLQEAAQGRPPPPEIVAKMQYGLILHWHHREQFLPIVKGLGNWDRKKLICRELTRGGGKSYIMAFLRLYAAEYVIPFLPRARNANKRMITFGRDSRHLHQEVMQTMAELILECAPWLKAKNWKEYGQDGGKSLADVMFKSRNWTKTRIDLTNGVSIRGYTIRQSVRGAHIYWVDIDDLLSEENVNFSQEYMDIIRGAILPAIEPGGLLMIDGTPQQPGDLYDVIRDDASWDYTSLPAIDESQSLGYREKNKEAVAKGWMPADAIKEDRDWDCLWPLRMNHRQLEQERGSSRASDLKFQREYLLRRILDTNQLVHPDDFIVAKDPSLSYERTGITGLPYYGGLDPSSLKRDDAGIVLGYIDKNGHRVLTWMEQIRATGQDTRDGEIKVLQTVNEMTKRFHYPKWMFESNGYQSVLKPLMRAIDPVAGAKIEEFFLASNKHTENGWIGIRTAFRSGIIRLPYGPTERERAMIAEGKLDPHDCEAVRMTDILIDQLRGIQVMNGKIVEDPKKKNDLVSALFLFLKSTEGVQQDASIASVAIKNRLMDAGVTLKSRDPEFISRSDRAAASGSKWTRASALQQRRRGLR